MEITIELLEKCPQHIPALTEIWCQTLGRSFPDVTASDIEKKLSTHLHVDGLPLAFVALCEGRPVGMCCLREDEAFRQDYVPRVSSLVVTPAYQRRGIGRMLMDAILQKARALGFRKIYLFAFDPIVLSWYFRMRGQKLGDDTFNNRIVTLMSLDLDS